MKSRGPGTFVDVKEKWELCEVDEVQWSERRFRVSRRWKRESETNPDRFSHVHLARCRRAYDREIDGSCT